MPKLRTPRQITHIKDLKADPKNARRHNPRNIGLIVDALGEVGAARSIVIDEGGRVLAGNGTVEAAAEAGITKVQVVDADGETIIAVRRKGLSAKQKKRLALYDNRAAELADWQPDVLAEFAAEDLTAGLFYDDELDRILADVSTQVEDGGAGLQAVSEPQPASDLPPVPDALFPTDNDWGIPLLDINQQAQHLHAPALVWGASGRKSKNPGTWLFYTEDYRYTRLWKSPNDLLATDCAAAVEPNFSCYDQMPRVLALWRIYQKRWLARYWQSAGVRVFADLNVATEFYDLNLLGIPDGWRAWATRGYSDRVEQTRQEWEMAAQKAGGEEGLIFLVYGGGLAVKRECQQRGWLFVPETMDVRKGKEAAYGG